MKSFDEFLAEGPPNKTVAAARKRMGGFPPRPPRDIGDFMRWIVDKAVTGHSFKTREEAAAAYTKETGKSAD